MKLSQKSLAVATLALASAGAAEANVAPSGMPAKGGEFTLAIVNLTDKVSYFLDMGTYALDFDTAVPYSRSINPTTPVDSAFAQFISSYNAGDDIVWGFGASYSTLDDVAQIPLVAYYGTTTREVETGAQTWSLADGAWNNMLTYNNTDSSTNFGINASSFRKLGDLGYLGDYGLDGSGTAAYNVLGSMNNPLFFVKDGVSGDSGELPSWNVLGLAELHLTSSTATVTYAPNVAAVPLPAAVWMMGAGVMGLLRATRRKSNAV